MTPRKTIALVGGTGLAQGLERILTNPSVHRDVTLRFGDRSGRVLYYMDSFFQGLRVILLPRHGPTLRIPDRSPAELVREFGFETHVWLFHELGVEAVYAFNAVGALDDTIPLASEGSLLIPNDYGRGIGVSIHSFGSLAKTVHPSMREPFSEELRRHLIHACQAAGVRAITSGLYIQNGPDAFESDAEIRATDRLYCGESNRVVGMTAGAEVVLCQQMEIPYALICANSNFAQGLRPEKPVSHGLVLETMEAASSYMISVAKHLLNQI